MHQTGCGVLRVAMGWVRGATPTNRIWIRDYCRRGVAGVVRGNRDCSGESIIAAVSAAPHGFGECFSAARTWIGDGSFGGLDITRQAGNAAAFLIGCASCRTTRGAMG